MLYQQYEGLLRDLNAIDQPGKSINRTDMQTADEYLRKHIQQRMPPRTRAHTHTHTVLHLPYSGSSVSGLVSCQQLVLPNTTVVLKVTLSSAVRNVTFSSSDKQWNSLISHQWLVYFRCFPIFNIAFFKAKYVYEPNTNPNISQQVHRNISRFVLSDWEIWSVENSWILGKLCWFSTSMLCERVNDASMQAFG